MLATHYLPGGGHELSTITIEVLGPQVVRKDGKEIPPPAPQQRRVLSLLASKPGEVVSREWLAEQLWGSASATQLRGLQSYVSHLRTALGSRAIELIGNGYRLAVSPDAVDEVRFREHLHHGNAALAQARYRDAIDAFTQGLALWRGTPYEDLPRGDFTSRRSGLNEARLAAEDALLRAQVEMLRDMHEAESLLPYSSELHAQEPRREGRVIQHMRCLSLAGRTSDVAAVAQEYRARLRSQAGAEPTQDFTDAVTDFVKRDAATRPLAWGSRVHLPFFTTPMVCRERELNLAASLLRSDSTRLLSVTGEEGVGKTRLAAAIAEDLGAELPGGVIWIEASSLMGKEGLVGLVAGELGLTQTGQELRMALPRELGKRRTLIVLDGLDDPEPLKDVATLLAAGPRLSVLATRQTPLGLASEHVLELHPFAVGKGDASAPAFVFIQRLLAAMGDGEGRESEEELDVKSLKGQIVATEGRAQLLEQIALDLLAARAGQLIA